MYDFWEIHVPFHTKWCTTQRVGAGASDIVGIVDLEECGRRGLTLGSRRVDFAIDREGAIHDLYHPWESLPSSFTDVACKLHQAQLKRSWPCIAIKASPAKLLQGHNVYGSDRAAVGILELLASFCRALPRVAEMLDWGHAHIRRVDVTYSIQLPDEETLANCLAAIGQLSHRHLRAPKEQDYESTLYFNRRSSDQKDAGRSVVRVIYAKLNEMKHQLDNLETLRRRERTSRYDAVIEQLKSPELQEFATNRLRFEGRAMTRFFERHKVPRNVWQFLTYVDQFEAREGYSWCEWAWRQIFEELFEALGSSRVELTQNNKVQKALRDAYGRCKHVAQPDGSIKEQWNYTRADRLMMFYRCLASEGWAKVKRLTASSSFYDSVNALLAVGLTKAQLQNLKQKQSLKLLHLIKVDFDAQRPANWTEPSGTVLGHVDDLASMGSYFGAGFVQRVGLSREQLLAQTVGELVGAGAADASVRHLIAGRPLRINEREQLHLAVLSDGSFELVRGDVSHLLVETAPAAPVFTSPSDDELAADFADAYLQHEPQFDARSHAQGEHQRLSVLLEHLRNEYAVAYHDPSRIGEAIQLRDRIRQTQRSVDRLWNWTHSATDSRGRTIYKGENHV
ncbi:phage/plasmid replication protein, II/X family [Aeromonas schubertii]